MNILFLSRWYPWPPDNGSKIRVFNLLKQLGRRHRVTLLTFADPPMPAPSSALRACCASIRVVPYRDFRPASGRAIAGIFTPQPRSLVDTHSAAMATAVTEALASECFELVVASQLAMAPYAIAQDRVPSILEELELSVFRDAAQHPSPGRRLRSSLTWLKLRAFLRRTLPRFAACTVVSERERSNVLQAVPGYQQVYVVPNAVDLDDYAGDFGQPRPDSIVFAGALTYRPNYDAADYLLRDVYPLVRRMAPQVSLRLTGSTNGVDLIRLPGHPGVEFTGHVPDVRPVVAQSCVSVVPLRRGGGTRLKILESMALGTPVVSTSKGAAGLEVTDGEDILLADTAHVFAERVVDVLRSPELHSSLANGGRRLVQARYDWAGVGERYCDLVERCAGQSQAGDLQLRGEGR